MTRILLRISYDGGAYGGWQIQPNAPTVQQRLQQAALDLFGAPTPVTGAGRTDSGVHALGQAAHLDTDRAIPAAKIAPALNARLPRDIRVTHSQRVPETFHARFSAHEKTYRYCFHVGEQPPALFRQYCFHAGRELDLAAMERAAGQLTGRHDFSAFQDVGRPVADATRTLSAVTLQAWDPRAGGPPADPRPRPGASPWSRWPIPRKTWEKIPKNRPLSLDSGRRVR